MIYMFLSNNPSSGDINLSNLSCYCLKSGHYFMEKCIVVMDVVMTLLVPAKVFLDMRS